MDEYHRRASSSIIQKIEVGSLFRSAAVGNVFFNDPIRSDAMIAVAKMYLQSPSVIAVPAKFTHASSSYLLPAALYQRQRGLGFSKFQQFQR